MVPVQFEFRNFKMFPCKNFSYFAYFPTVSYDDIVIISFIILDNNNYDDHNKRKNKFSAYKIYDTLEKKWLLSHCFYL